MKNSTASTIAAAIETSAPAPVETPTSESPGVTPAVQQPTTPEQLRDLKLSQVFDQKPTFATYLACGLAALTGWAKENVEIQTRVKGAAEKFRKTAKHVGKMLAAMKVAYVQAQEAGTLSKDTGFDDYHKKVTGENPWNHALQCARVFAELVLTGRLSESDYDRRAADWHQTASVILGAIKKNGGDLNSPEVAELVDVLKNAADDEGAKSLRKLRNKIQGKETAKPGDPEVLTVTDLRNADVLVRRICQLDYESNGVKIAGMALVARIVTEYAKNEKREEVLKAVYIATNQTLDVCGTPDDQEKWIADFSANVMPAAKAA
jgi:hypothetical protein